MCLVSCFLTSMDATFNHPLLVNKLMILEMEKKVGNVYLEAHYNVHCTLCNLNWRKVFGNVN